ncbi:hypothetical protein [Streptomyces sp. MNU89]|uniref:hypothetical protein n=1 Tax=Streptomyces sp. MNU89 TaxID=2560025 RepID=UPI001E3F4321|nr:hypothetical protein [Streptomyces sp. MNU89]MCC9741101.1 hypothetical protein [Streptomyces sp. MNU89]
MYGPVPVPPQPRPPDAGNVIALRVLFVAMTLLLLGLLAWTAMLRIALLRRKALDWVLFGAVVGLTITFFVVIEIYPETDWRTDVAALGLLGMAVAVVAHYLVADIQYHRRPVAVSRPGGPAGPGPYGAAASRAQTYAAGGVPTRPGSVPAQQQPPGVPAYGFPHPPATSGPGGSATPPQGPPPSVPGAGEPYAPGTAGSRPQPQRIHRVRAELDELSDLLRREEGGAAEDGSGPR